MKLYEKTFPNIVIIAVTAILLLWGAAQSAGSYYWKARYRALDEQCQSYRARLDDFERREQNIKAITDEAVRYAGRAEQIIDRDIQTIREVREQIKDLADYCDKLELLLFGIRSTVNDKEKIE